MFASRSVSLHLLRGVGGFVALAGAFAGASSSVYSWLLLPVALLLLKGCPMCWVVGLVMTVLQRKDPSLCLDGSCLLEERPRPPG